MLASAKPRRKRMRRALSVRDLEDDGDERPLEAYRGALRGRAFRGTKRHSVPL